MQYFREQVVLLLTVISIVREFFWPGVLPPSGLDAGFLYELASNFLLTQVSDHELGDHIGDVLLESRCDVRIGVENDFCRA